MTPSIVIRCRMTGLFEACRTTARHEARPDKTPYDTTIGRRGMTRARRPID